MPKTRIRYIWRFLLGADTRHALVHGSDWRALCGRTPTLAGSWLGEGNRAAVESRRACQRCEHKIGVTR